MEDTSFFANFDFSIKLLLLWVAKKSRINSISDLGLPFYRIKNAERPKICNH
jgi:hypothetical protein